MNLDNAYSIQGLAYAFQELNEHNTVLISKLRGSGWDELVETVVGLLHGMKCGVQTEEDDENFRITVLD